MNTAITQKDNEMKCAIFKALLNVFKPFSLLDFSIGKSIIHYFCFAPKVKIKVNMFPILKDVAQINSRNILSVTIYTIIKYILYEYHMISPQIVRWSIN